MNNVLVVQVCESEGDVDRKTDPGVPSKLFSVVLYPLGERGGGVTTMEGRVVVLVSLR